MRIVHLITTLDVGGAEMHVLAQVRGQIALGHDVEVVYLKGQGSLADELRAAGARVGRGVRALWPALGRADRVHTHLLKADMLGAVLATLRGRRGRLVASKHNDEQVLLRPAVSFVHGWLGRAPRRTIVLSDHVGRFIEEHGRIARARLRRIYYGLDPRPFEEALRCCGPGPQARAARAALRASLGLREEDVVFVCVARFAPQKAHDVLLRAFARLEHPAARLLLVGGDPFGTGLEKAQALARELDLAGRVVFAGIRRDVPELMAASDGFVMASLWEGLGLVYLEAMATGLPIVASQVSAVPEVVVDGTTGLLVRPGDDETLAAALRRLAADPALRERLGRAGRERVRERFGLQRMIDETLAVYEELQAP